MTTRRLCLSAVGLLLLTLAGTSAARAQTPPTRGQLAGDLPTAGGYALAVWGGGTIDELSTAAASRGCPLVATWVIERDGFLGNVLRAPAVVNQAWGSRFPGGPPNGAVIVVCGGAPATAAATSGARTIGGCPLFPDDNPWATDVSRAAVDPRSDAYVSYILAAGGNKNLHADFGSNPDYGIPYVIVPQSQTGVPVTFDYADESDRVPYPLPANVPIEAGSDHHALVVQQDSCKLFELFALSSSAAGWHAGSGAVFDLRSNALRPDGWTSADAAGLPILPGLVRYDEVRAGAINHALRFTVSRTQRGYIHPATHLASSITDPNAPPMGLRLRLKASFDTSRYHGDALVVLTTLKRYGMFVADNGSNWFITGATDTRWDDDDLNQLKTVPGSAFEAVATGPVVTR
jgi:hypothetical protein